MPLVQKKHIKRAVANVIAHGDTDVFPFPFENWMFRERPEDVYKILERMDKDFDSLIESNSPQFESTLAPAGYTGFRWATQIDPFWNAYLLAVIIACGEKIEAARIPASEQTVHSYRFTPDGDGLYDKDYGWASFMRRSYDLSQSHSYIVSTDISEFYRRVGHHRLENALDHVIKNQLPDRILAILGLFSNGASYGLPIGGPAARLLSEITINQVDRILQAEGLVFTRFADDYHIFTSDTDSAYKALQFLSETLITNQGLTLQKSKTRIMQSGEFRHSYPKHLLDETPDLENKIESDTVKLLKLSVHYDPYSSTASADYAALKQQLADIDVVGLLAAEANKAQINVAVSKRIVSAIVHLPEDQRLSAVKTLMDNKEQFFPITTIVLQVIKAVMSSSSDEIQKQIADLVRLAASESSHVFRPDLHMAYVVRILAESGSEEDLHFLHKLYASAPAYIRKDIILAYAKHGYWYLLSNLRSRFSAMTPWEKRAFLFASYAMGDEGRHWRDKISIDFAEVDMAMRSWISSLKTSDSLKVRV